MNWSDVTPIISNILAVIVTGVISWLASVIQRRFNIEIEAKYRESLHSAAMTGVNAALSRIGGKVSDLTIPTKQSVVKSGVEYMSKSVPDAVAALGATPQVMTDIATSKLTLIEAAQATPIVAVALSNPLKGKAAT